jgi:putative RecB family exonuclease
MLRSVGCVQGQLGLEGIPSKLVRVTPARLAVWEGCPRRYRMTYLDRPTPVRTGAWAHSTLGAVVHNALRAFFELRPQQRTAERAAMLVRRHWKSEGFANPAQAAEYRQRAERWVSDYVGQLDVDATPLAVERWVSAPTGTIIAEGRVDRIDQRNGELVVVDYKTGRHALSVQDARDSLALALYALASRKALHRPCHRVELHHLPTGQVVGWDHTEESLGGHLERAERLAEELQAATDAWEEGADTHAMFPPRTGRHCSWCDFRAHCPEGQHAAPEIPPWGLLRE